MNPKTLIVSPAVYSRLDDFTRKINFRIKSRSTQLKLSKPVPTHSRGYPKFPNQHLRQIGQGGLEL